MDEYQSSEELQRQHSMDVFAKTVAKKPTDSSDKDRLGKLLDIYINTHNSTVGVKSEAEKHGRDNGYQLDLSADIVAILTKIKSELR